ncbi:MAG: O-acetylhomoserine aminocarboxypropyltransferase/cysteine synthase family protein [Bacillota bacterium]
MNNLETLCIQGGYEPKNGEARTVPIYQTTTYYYEKPSDMADLFDLKTSGYFYSRIGNPTCAALEDKMASMEGGSGALATASGQSASFIAMFNVCSAGDHIISQSTIYGGTYNLLAVTLKKMGIECSFITPEATAEEIDALVRPNTKVIFGETFANPAMTVLDFDKLSSIAKKHNILFMVDNTLATSVVTKPKDFGANVVIYSTTKYTEGHAGTIGGMIVDCGNFTFDEKRYPEYCTPDESYHGLVYNTLGAAAYITKARVQLMRDFGCYMSAQTAHLTNLGMETLSLRMEKHSQNGLAVAKFLDAHDGVEWVKYPHLETDADYALGKKYMKMGSGVVVFGIKGGKEVAEQFILNLKLIKQVTHVADIRSCVLHPASTTHRQLSPEALVECGISENLIRLSIGCEATEDIIADIQNALANI